MYRNLQSGRRHHAVNLSKILQKRKKKLEIQIQMSKLDKISEVSWEITCMGIMLLREQNSVFRRAIFSALMSRDKRKLAFAYFMRQPSKIFWNIDGDNSLSEPWICVTRFELLNKDPSEGHMWVQGRLTKEEVTARPEYIWPEEWSRLSKNSHRLTISKNGQKKNQNWTQRENDEEFNSSPKIILIMWTS